MPIYFDSKLKLLSGIINDVNKIFTTPSNFVSGSIKVFLNGQSYEPDDENYGWSEVDEQTIEMDNAPLTNDVLQAFYQDQDSAHEGWDGVKGSPFDPHGVIP